MPEHLQSTGGADDSQKEVYSKAPPNERREGQQLIGVS
jgi:hypothetical protein